MSVATSGGEESYAVLVTVSYEKNQNKATKSEEVTMNVQAHMSGQISGQVPNQGTMSQQNGNSQMQNLVAGGGAVAGPPRVSPADNDLLKLRQSMRNKM